MSFWVRLLSFRTRSHSWRSVRNLIALIVVFFSISLSPSLSHSEEGVIYIYKRDHRQVREEKGKDISLYVDGEFKRAREAKTYGGAWDTYVAIQKGIPEELINQEGHNEDSSASARLTAWTKMKRLLDEARQNEGSNAALQFLHSPLGAEPPQKLFQKAWEKATEDHDFSPYDGFEFSWLLVPHLPTKTGGRWVEKIGDSFVEQGNFLRAYAQYKAIKDYSIAYSERIEKKLNYVKIGLGAQLNKIEKAIAVAGLKLTDGTVYRLVMEELEMHKEKTPFLEITFPKGKIIRKQIYDFELTHLNSRKYGPLLIRDEDKIILTSLLGQTPLPLVFDLNGMLLEKKVLTKEVASRYGIKGINEHLFSKGDFAHIPSGTFEMGSPSNEKGRNSNEMLHTVTLTKDFYLQKTEVTQLQWYLIMEEAPSYFRNEEHCKEDYDKDLEICPNNPVEQVSWDQVQVFIQRLNERQTEYIYRLPTEAEWEYAARGGKEEQTAYSFGDDSEILKKYAWFSENSEHGNGNRGPHKVATKKPTKSFGEDLYDMHGNVLELVQDWYGYGEYSTGSVIDPQGPSTGSYRVYRGGSWRGDLDRSGIDPDCRSGSVGLRLVRQ